MNYWDAGDEWEELPPEPEYTYDDYMYDRWKMRRDDGLAPTIKEMNEKGWQAWRR